MCMSPLKHLQESIVEVNEFDRLRIEEQTREPVRVAHMGGIVSLRGESDSSYKAGVLAIQRLTEKTSARWLIRFESRLAFRRHRGNIRADAAVSTDLPDAGQIPRIELWS